MLEHVLAHLAVQDVRALRLTAKAFSSHPAVLSRCTSAHLPSKCTEDQQQAAAWQAGLNFLCRLPRLERLDLHYVRSLYGFQLLTHLSKLSLYRCPTVLDLTALRLLPKLHCLELQHCPCKILGNLSVLCGLTELAVTGESLHADASKLTGLKALRLYEQEELASSSSVCSGLTGLTFLADSSDGEHVWRTLPCLRALHIVASPTSVSAIAAITALQALYLDVTELNPGLLSLDPLSTLVHLERLSLLGRASPLPGLAALTRLSIESLYPGQELVGMSGVPMLLELHLELFEDMHLPDLAGPCPNLSRIVFSDCEGQATGRLTIDFQEFLSRRLSAEHRSRILGIDEDDY